MSRLRELILNILVCDLNITNSDEDGITVICHRAWEKYLV